MGTDKQIVMELCNYRGVNLLTYLLYVHITYQLTSTLPQPLYTSPVHINAIGVLQNINELITQTTAIHKTKNVHRSEKDVTTDIGQRADKEGQTDNLTKGVDTLSTWFGLLGL